MGEISSHNAVIAAVSETETASIVSFTEGLDVEVNKKCPLVHRLGAAVARFPVVGSKLEVIDNGESRGFVSHWCHKCYLDCASAIIASGLFSQVSVENERALRAAISAVKP